MSTSAVVALIKYQSRDKICFSPNDKFWPNDKFCLFLT